MRTNGVITLLKTMQKWQAARVTNSSSKDWDLSLIYAVADKFLYAGHMSPSAPIQELKDIRNENMHLVSTDMALSDFVILDKVKKILIKMGGKLSDFTADLSLRFWLR